MNGWAHPRGASAAVRVWACMYYMMYYYCTLAWWVKGALYSIGILQQQKKPISKNTLYIGAGGAHEKVHFSPHIYGFTIY